MELMKTEPMTAVEVRSRINRIQEVMRAVMKEGTHYGTIPGTNKPTLYKAGSEVLLATFRIAVEPDSDDLSTADEIRYRVRAKGIDQGSGIFLGSGIGECSSSEEKYRWRSAICDEEWNETPEDRRRNVWKKGNPPYQIKQVRTNPADVANTILKMAKKRAQIDMTLTVTGASDIFTQDIEDLPAEYINQGGEGRKPVEQPRRKSESADGSGKVENIETKNGKSKAGKPYTKYTITIGGEKYGTFDKAHAETAEKARLEGAVVKPSWTQSQYGRDLTGLEIVQAPPPSEPPKEPEPDSAPPDIADEILDRLLAQGHVSEQEAQTRLDEALAGINAKRKYDIGKLAESIGKNPQLGSALMDWLVEKGW